MKITLKDAYANATPLPLHCGYGKQYCFHDGNHGCIAHLTPAEKSGNGEDTEETVAEVWPGPTDRFDTALMTHAYNVLPKVMEALERAELSTTQIRLAASIGRKSAQSKVQWYEKQLEQLGRELRTAIVKAATVEIP